MSKKNTLIVCNWKMNGSLQLCREFGDLFSSINKENNNEEERSSDSQFLPTSAMVICPPSVYIPEIAKKIKYVVKKNINLDANLKQDTYLTSKKMQIALGAQNIAIGSRAQTGEINCDMLREFGCGYVILGRSERRKMYGEDIYVACNKAAEVLANGMVPIICVGESLETYDQGRTNEYIRSEMAVIKQMLIGKINELRKGRLGNSGGANYAEVIQIIVIAYEPVYAIGSGVVPNLNHINDVSTLIHDELQDNIMHYKYNFNIIYGGSVNIDNYLDILDIKYISGLLLGGVSLQLKDLGKISNILLTF